jgi:23S rRNA (uridine2552-2'-O)-methyltransferase
MAGGNTRNPPPEHGGQRSLSVRLRTALGRSPASQRWLRRQLNDPFVVAAKAEGWRSRAAFKLLALDDRYHLLGKGTRVLDLGAAPGSWSQVALKRGAARVVGIDLLPIAPLPGAEFLQGDCRDPELLTRLRQELGGAADLVLSDMAPNTTGHAATDHVRIVALAEIALDCAVALLVPGGAFVAKVFQGGSERDLLAILKARFTTVHHAKPAASRKESSELYVVATGFRPLR